MKDWIDLHVHSNYSDGTMTPAQLVELALQKGLKAFALTDHDTTDGIPEALSAAQGTDLLVIPGIELSTAYQDRDIHILGLNIDIDNSYFQERLTYFQEERNRRNRKMIQKLQEHGLAITEEEMLASFSDSVWTRAHFARFLMDSKQVHSMEEAFHRYLGDHAPCFVKREKITPHQAVDLIHLGHGKAVLAHPLLYHLKTSELDELVRSLAHVGLDGIEAIYSTHSQADESLSRHLARKYNLLITGGSDFHGSNKPSIDLGSGRGRLFVPAELLSHL